MKTTGQDALVTSDGRYVYKLRSVPSRPGFSARNPNLAINDENHRGVAAPAHLGIQVIRASNNRPSHNRLRVFKVQFDPGSFSM